MVFVFEVEFLIRDANQFTGLEDGMARDEQKLHTHFNIALTVVSVAKAAYYLSLPKSREEAFPGPISKSCIGTT